METLFRFFPEPARSVVRAAWAGVPAENRKELEQWMPQAAGDLGGVKDLLSFIFQNYALAFDSAQRTIAIVGPANSGKSTLYNQLISRKEDRARVSPVAGTTREVQRGGAGPFTVLDTPGADLAGQAGEKERRVAFEAASGADFLVILFDASQGIRSSEQELFDSLRALGKPFLVVLNKMDLVQKQDRATILAAAGSRLGLDQTQIIDIVATEGTNVGRVVLAITQLEPRLLLLVAEALPQYHMQLAWQRIAGAAAAAASVALIPLPLADVVPLLGIQAGLVLTIARIYGYEITPGRAKELIAAFGLGLIARTVYRQLSKFLGVPGWILSAAIAASATVAMGYAAVEWFERGERPTDETLERITRDVGLYLKDQLATLRENRSDRASLRRRLAESLERLRLDRSTRHSYASVQVFVPAPTFD